MLRGYRVLIQRLRLFGFIVDFSLMKSMISLCLGRLLLLLQRLYRPTFKLRKTLHTKQPRGGSKLHYVAGKQHDAPRSRLGGHRFDFADGWSRERLLVDSYSMGRTKISQPWYSSRIKGDTSMPTGTTLMVQHNIHHVRSPSKQNARFAENVSSNFRPILDLD